MSRSVVRVLALTVHPERAPATRFRVLAYRSLLEAQGIEVTLASSLDDAAFELLYAPQSLSRKGRAALRALIRQWRAALFDGPWDTVWVQREAALVGPPLLELLLASRRPLVYDFDDAVWLSTADASRHPLAARLLRAPDKTRTLMREARHVMAGSAYLAEAARRVNPNVSVIPTVVSRETWVPSPRAEREVPVVGWIGTHGTARYLHMVAPALERLRAEGRRFHLRIVGAAPDFVLPVEHERVVWSLDREIEAFQDLDIGLAPVADDEWGRGKCAFKQLQYFATGVACVSSPVGPAADFCARGAALAARDADDWYRSLAALLDDAALRARLRETARHLMETELCIEALTPRVAAILREPARPQR
ncbi:MAG: glycosyltransferase [Sandaracinaceae bacterium]|nr:glycosyltransferase [Sandaracinaceae bacterium]